MQPHSTYTLHPSRRLTMLYPLLCMGALISLWSLPLPSLFSLAASAAVLAWGLYRLQYDARLRMQDSCVAFRLEDDDAVMLVLRSGRHVPGRIRASSLVTPFMVILNVALENRRMGRNLVLMPDSMGRLSFRRLRVALRWGGKSSQSTV